MQNFLALLTISRVAKTSKQKRYGNVSQLGRQIVTQRSAVHKI